VEIAVRSHMRAGVIALSASAIVLSPLAPSTPAVHLPSPSEVSSAAVRLAAAYNPLQPWIDVFQTAGADVQQLGQAFFQAPAVLLQQILANQVTHIGEVLKNPGSIGTVLGQVAKNVGAVVQAATLLNTDYNGPQIYGSADGWHNILVQEIPKLLPTVGNAQATKLITNVLNVLASPLSGVAIGLAGPLLSPVVALVNSATAVIKSLMAGHLVAAVQSLINIPAQMVGAVLNGATINLNGLAPLINNAHILSDDTTLHGLSLALGGLLSPGAVGDGGTSGTVFGVGGSIVNALGQSLTTSMMGFPLDLDIPGQAVGPIGALIGFGRALAKALGWSGTGNPLAAKSASATAGAAGTQAVAASATSIPSTTTKGVTVSPTKVVAAASTTTKPKAAVASTTESDSVKTDTRKTDTVKADTGKTDSGKTDAGKTDSSTSASTKSDSSKSDSSKSSKHQHRSKHNSAKSSTHSK
jgi:hypothetical protein